MPDKYPKSPRELSPTQAKFVAAYLRHGNASKAAIEAGYSDGTHASRLLTKPQVKEALAKARAEMIEQGIYNANEAMREAQEAIEFAKETGNANAYVKAVELRSKLHGLLIEKHDHRLASNFAINILGINESPTEKEVINEESDLLSSGSDDQIFS